MSTAKDNRTYWVGIDGGGTKSHAVLFDAQYQVLGEGRSGPANIARHGKQALNAILGSVEQAVANSGLSFDSIKSELSVSAGLAGACLDSSVALLERWQHPFGDFTFTSDLHTALLGAHGGGDGAVLITGTGSCAASLVNGQITQFGGFGFQLGDQGSGAWLGQQAIQLALLHADGITSAEGLWHAAKEVYGCNTPAQIVDLLNGASSAEFARFAPQVFTLASQADECAQQLIQQGADYLNTLVMRALADSSMPLVFNGGLAALWLPYLDAAIRAHIRPAQYSAEWGAVYFCRRGQSCPA
ncbi:BadF/BadG/BcrA/BcrD ATPase family protein [Alteromonas gilva]|uniref:BadF/BadG/BcrA/BcrD ATPase family protein n=1 Tax=Alteromonas gilva TaxID=2987522 RepID=A0ABT5L572_9ALTE|nr:BadF/BadG/BcrA/BcrD ATPase family protein [Alteromonas gilva]MDC8832203.1 BadF/BadG/BcrA/BcrD ATPase family protein [Alteromonas gilva]